jgi:hypothetical protein
MDKKLHSIAQDVTRQVLIAHWGESSFEYFADMNKFEHIVSKAYNAIIDAIKTTTKQITINSHAMRKQGFNTDPRCGDLWSIRDGYFLVDYVTPYLICIRRSNAQRTSFQSKSMFADYVGLNNGSLISRWEEGKYPFCNANGYSETTDLMKLTEKFSLEYIENTVKDIKSNKVEGTL